MLPVTEAPELDIREYEPSLDILPKQTFYQALNATSYNNSSITFDIRSPSPNAILDARWFLSAIMQFKTAGILNAGDKFGQAAGGFFYTEYVNSFSNAIQNITLTINGASISIPFGDFARELGLMSFGKKSYPYLSVAGGGGGWDCSDRGALATDGIDYGAAAQYPSNLNCNGATRTIAAGTRVGAVTDVFKGEAVRRSTQLQKLVDVAGGGNLSAQDPIKIFQGVGVPPLNWTDGKGPVWSWFRKMSKNLVHFNVCQLTINLKAEIGPLMINCNASDVGQARRERVLGGDNVFPEAPVLNLRWYQPPPNYVIPREVSYQCWYPQIYSRRSAGTVTNGENFVQGEYLRLDQIPSLIMFSVQLDTSLATFGSATTPAGEIAGFPKLFYQEITKLQLTVNTDAGAIIAEMPQQMLYELTRENMGEDWGIDSYEVWKDCGYCIVALRPHQIPAFNQSPGVTYPTNLSAKVTFNTHLGGTATASNFKIMCFYDRYYLTVTPSSAKFSYQNLSDRAAAVTLAQASRVASGAPAAYTSRV